MPLLGPSDLIDGARALGAAARMLGESVSAAGRLLPRLEQALERGVELLDALERRGPEIADVLDDAADAAPSLAQAAPHLPRLAEDAAALTARVDALLDLPGARELAALIGRIDSTDLARRCEVAGQLLDSGAREVWSARCAP